MQIWHHERKKACLITVPISYRCWDLKYMYSTKNIHCYTQYVHKVLLNKKRFQNLNQNLRLHKIPPNICNWSKTRKFNKSIILWIKMIDMSWLLYYRYCLTKLNDNAGWHLRKSAGRLAVIQTGRLAGTLTGWHASCSERFI